MEWNKVNMHGFVAYGYVLPHVYYKNHIKDSLVLSINYNHIKIKLENLILNNIWIFIPKLTINEAIYGCNMCWHVKKNKKLKCYKCYKWLLIAM